MNPFPLFRYPADGVEFVYSEEVGGACVADPKLAESCEIEAHAVDLDCGQFGPPARELLGLLWRLLEDCGSLDSFVASYRLWADEYGDGFRPLLGKIISQAFTAGYVAAQREKR